MSALERADRLKEPPVVGQQYLVPSILWDRNHYGAGRRTEAEVLKGLQGPYAKWWPVWGRKHNDLEFFKFQEQHYHIDPRFLTRRQWRAFAGWRSRTPLQELQGRPLTHTGLPSGPPKPVLRKMRCTLAHAEWGHSEAIPVCEMNESFKGRQCASGKRGLVCPHRLFPLGSVKAIDGVVTCPLHGLRIDAKSGVCIGPEPRP